MINLKKTKTKKLLLKALSISTIVSTTLLFTGCSDSNDSEVISLEDTYQEYQSGESEPILMDDEGRKYKLHLNEDGSETAIYESGEEITFKRDGDTGELRLLSVNGDSSEELLSTSVGLLAGLATGYFLFNGYQSPVGSISGSSYVPSSRPAIMSSFDRQKQWESYLSQAKDKERVSGGAAVPFNNPNNSNSASSGATSSKPKVDLSKSTTNQSSTAKSGFGSVGARSSAVS